MCTINVTEVTRIVFKINDFFNLCLAEIRKLLEKLPSQCLVCRGEEKSWTSLHRTTHIGHVGTIDDIIWFSPECMDAVDTEGQNFLHITVKFEQYVVVKHLLETNDITEHILNRSDKYGNTPLHVIVETGNQNMVFCLF